MLSWHLFRPNLSFAHSFIWWPFIPTFRRKHSQKLIVLRVKRAFRTSKIGHQCLIWRPCTAKSCGGCHLFISVFLTFQPKMTSTRDISFQKVWFPLLVSLFVVKLIITWRRYHDHWKYLVGPLISFVFLQHQEHCFWRISNLYSTCTGQWHMTRISTLSPTCSSPNAFSTRTEILMTTITFSRMVSDEGKHLRYAAWFFLEFIRNPRVCVGKHVATSIVSLSYLLILNEYSSISIFPNRCGLQSPQY